MWDTAVAELRDRNKEYGILWGAIGGTEIRSMQGNNASVLIETDTETIHHMTSNFFTWASGQHYLDTPLLEHGRFIAEDMITNLAGQILSNRIDGDTYQDMLSRMADYHAGLIMDELRNFAALDFGARGITRTNTLLYRPATADRELGAVMLIPYRPDVFSYGGEGGLLSRKELKKQLKATAMRIQKRPHDDVKPRLIGIDLATQTKLDELARDGDLVAFDNADLILKLDKDLFKNQPNAPFVIGYELVNGDPETARYAYRYTPDQDSYAPCNVMLPAEAQQKLADTYAAIGLAPLAAAVQRATNLTVGRLTTIIRESGSYYTGSKTIGTGKLDSLEDFQKMMHNNRLVMQCTGWSRFLEHSLNMAFEGPAATMASGYVMGRYGTRISQVGHAQTRFTDPQTRRVFHLDATPGNGGFENLGDMLNKEWDMLKRSIGSLLVKKVTTTPQPPVLPAPAPVRTEAQPLSPEAVRDAALISATETLYTNLRMIFGKNGQLISQEALQDTIAVRGPDDLLFRTVADIRAAGRGEPDALNNINRLISYIERLQDSDDRPTLKRLDPHRYTQHPWLLRSLTDTLEEARRLLTATPE